MDNPGPSIKDLVPDYISKHKARYELRDRRDKITADLNKLYDENTALVSTRSQLLAQPQTPRVREELGDIDQIMQLTKDSIDELFKKQKDIEDEIKSMK